MNDCLKITYSSTVENLCEFNSSFDHGVLKVAYVGKNRNGSSISKEVFENCIGTIYNCPVVCNYNRDRDEIGSHDVDLVVKDGVPTIVNITQPVGVVPESAKYWFEEYEDITGIHEYLCVEVLIWKRQEAYAKIKENVITDESMEIRVKSGHTTEDGVYVIDSFEFLAFCLLETAEPCYESAALEMFSMNDFRQRYAEMMADFKRDFKLVNASIEDGIDNKIHLEGGVKQLEQKMELLSRFGLNVEDLDFDFEPMSVEELEMEIKKRKLIDDEDDNMETPADEPEVVEPEENPEVQEESVEEPASGEEPEDSQFALSGEQFREGLINALSAEKIETVWGEMSRYCYCDYDSEASEVYCYDTEDWKLYGFNYFMNGDNVVIDFESKKRKKISIVDFDEGDAEFSYKHVFDVVAGASASNKASELTTQFEAQRAELEDKFNAASDTINEMNIELNELRSFKQQQLDSERVAAEDAVFSMFADLNGIEAFETLRANCADMTIEEIEEKCYAMRGRNHTVKFSAEKPQQKSTRLPVERTPMPADEPYKGLFLEFPPNR